MDNKWSQEIYSILSMWVTQINNLKKLHKKESISLSKKDNIFSNLIILISGLGSLGSFINLSDFDKKTKFIITLLVGIVGLISCIFSSIYNKLKMGEASVIHKNMVDEYSSLGNLIQTTAALKTKPSASEFLKLITDRMDLIHRYGPPLVNNGTSISAEVEMPNFAGLRNALKRRKTALLNESDIKLFVSPSSEEDNKKKEDEIIEIDLGGSTDD